MTDHLAIVKTCGQNVTFRQREFADAWQFFTSGDCVNFGQTDPATTSDEGEGGEVEGWSHLCDLDLFIEMLVELREKLKSYRTTPEANRE